jgi:hypothetical protein
MIQRPALLLLTATLLVPGALRAADVLPAAPAAGSSAPVVFRLSADGDWLGAVRAGDGNPELLVAPLLPSPRLGSGTLTIGGLFSVPTGDGQRLVVGAQQQTVPTIALAPLPSAWCQGVVGVVANAAECLPQGLAGAPLQPALNRLQGAAAWSSRSLDLALTVGSTSGWAAGASSWVLPSLAGDARAAAPALVSPAGIIDSRDISLSGLWRIAPWGGLTLSASVGEANWQVVPGTAPLAIDQAAVQFGMVRGAFSGGITGRVMRPGSGFEGAYPMWTGLDIGIAWRTPWRGELAIGAQNLIGRSSDALPAPVVPAIDEATARTPYVRYTQDL